MKNKLKPDFVPRSTSRMPKKRDKANQQWLNWQHPKTAQPPTNKERMVEKKLTRDRKIIMLNQLIKQTKEAHPNEKRSYREWVDLAVAETKQVLYE